MKPSPNQVMTAQDLLNAYIVFQHITPDYNDWKEKTLKKSPPRMLRYQMINSFLRAFSIGDKLTSDFFDGSFLESKEPTDYKYLANQYKSFIKNRNISKDKENAKDSTTTLAPFDIKYLFERLLDYRTKIFGVLQHNDYLHAVPQVDRFYQHFVSAYVKQSTVFLLKIDKLLCSIIDPQNKKFTVKELIEDYDYPDVDLVKIDFDLL
ncbi:MAG: hypothetical protein FD143_1840 [Ignavibacteria bacterium]|nr:MAG: hypothetical protein FD143_1840 [Ignavibacteria bacterium]KAF0157714.1 MAG: hypothetical protein FD188_2693 [Ignavibacteria bacterium]